MLFEKHFLTIILLQTISFSHEILVEENGKDLPTNQNYDLLARRRKPSSAGGGGAGCNFNGVRGKPKTDGTGRTFFDLQFINVGYHYNYDINCGGGGAHPPAAGGGIHKPIIGGETGGGGFNKPIFQKPHHKPILGGLLQQGGQDPTGEHQEGGFLSNRPLLSALFGNRPLQGIFSQSQSQSQAQTGAISGAISGITDLLPKPQDIGQGLGEGISSFVSTLPQIGQSFQSLLPSFENFQLPTFPSLFQGGQTMAPAPSPGTGAVTPVGPDPTDPDDVIYNDDIKPVHEEHDPVTDTQFTNKLPPGAYLNRNKEQINYQQNRNYYDQKLSNYVNQNRYHYQKNGDYNGQNSNGYRDQYREYEGRSRHGDRDDRNRGRTFRFPS